MGIDRVPARPRPGADLDELRALSRAQGSAPDVEDQLPARLDIPVTENGHWPCFRTAVIGANPRFPPDWRAAAYRTFLPDDARRAVDRWQWWYTETTAGYLGHYLARLAAHEAAQQLTEAQATLLHHVDHATTRSNAWTRTDRFHDTCARARALPATPAIPPPGEPPATRTDDAPTPDQENHSRVLATHVALAGEAIRAFNRTVPAALSRRRARLRHRRTSTPAIPGSRSSSLGPPRD
ncbi:hypothetical protein ACFQX7_10255 [Luedemannella flava]